MKWTEVIVKLLDLLAKVRSPLPDPLAVLRDLLDIALLIVPHEVAVDELGQAAIRRANAIADGLEAAKGLE